VRVHGNLETQLAPTLHVKRRHRKLNCTLAIDPCEILCFKRLSFLHDADISAEGFSGLRLFGRLAAASKDPSNDQHQAQDN
jgi:hypothetical protein